MITIARGWISRFQEAWHLLRDQKTMRSRFSMSGTDRPKRHDAPARLRQIV